MKHLLSASVRDYARDRGYGCVHARDHERGARSNAGACVLQARPCAQNKKQAACRPCAGVCKYSPLVTGNRDNGWIVCRLFVRSLDMTIELRETLNVLGCR
jgi:hypothetical protein